MTLTKDAVLGALSAVQHPTAGKDVVSGGAVVKLAACDNIVALTLAAGGVPPAAREGLRAAADRAIRGLAERSGQTLQGLTIDLAEVAPLAAAPRPANAGGGGGGGEGAAAQQSKAPVLPGVRHAIAVGAGKGGVGKSTVAVNLAVGLARKGYAVGLLDGDIYGPSLPTMMGLHALQVNILGNMLQPFLVHGVKAMTIGKLVDPEKALIWRGPMAHGAFKQLVEQTNWGELDYLIIDLPPGTGDVSLTLAQLLRLTGAVVVCTPQRVAQDDAVRAFRMFGQLGIEVLGVVENMSYFIGDDGKEYDLFGRGGAQAMAARLNTPFLGGLPINMALRKHGDSGDPLSNFDRDIAGDTLVRDLERMVANVEAQVALSEIRAGAGGPMLTIS